MAYYKNAKYPAFLLTSLCLSLNAFGSAAVSSFSPPLEGKDGSEQMKRKFSEISAPAASSSGGESSALPTREAIHAGLARKAKVLISELPKARAALERVDGELTTKARGLQSTNFLRATELAGLVSSAKVLNASVYNTMAFAAKECRNDNDLAMLGVAIVGSSSLKADLIKFSKILADKEDTRDIDCRVLMDVSAKIHEITKDIDANFQDFRLSDHD